MSLLLLLLQLKCHFCELFPLCCCNRFNGDEVGYVILHVQFWKEWLVCTLLISENVDMCIDCRLRILKSCLYINILNPSNP